MAPARFRKVQVGDVLGLALEHRVRRQVWGSLTPSLPEINARLFLASRAWMTRVSLCSEPHEACIGSHEPPQLSSL